MSRTLPLSKSCSCTVVIEIWRMRRMLRWRNTSSLSICDFRSDQVSAPHKSRFIGIAQKRRYLLYMSRWGLRHSSFRAPIEAFAAAILAVMWSSSCRLYDMCEPRYLNVRVKLTKPSATGSDNYLNAPTSLLVGLFLVSVEPSYKEKGEEKIEVIYHVFILSHLACWRLTIAHNST
jgi:hypothetical protein